MRSASHRHTHWTRLTDYAAVSTRSSTEQDQVEGEAEPVDDRQRGQLIVKLRKSVPCSSVETRA